MTSKERVLKAMKIQKPDRVPVMCQFSIGFMNQQLKETNITPMELWNDAEKYAEALIWLCERFNFDGILVSLFGHDSKWREKAKTEIVEGIEVATFNDRKEKYLDDDLPFCEFFEDANFDIDTLDLSELPRELNYIPASTNCDIFIAETTPYEVFRILDEKLKGKYSIHAEVTSPLDYLLDLLGYENALIAMMTNPDKVKEILEIFTKGVVKMAEGLCENTSADAIKISSPFAGSDFISPENYKEFELPYVSQVVQAIKNKGRQVYIHTCGHIDDRLEMMAESGMTGIECLDPAPIGNVELSDAFNRIGNKVFIKGNIDSVHTLLNGSDEKIISNVTEKIEIGMQNKGFILSTACSIAPMVKKENVKKLSEIANNIGIYK